VLGRLGDVRAVDPLIELLSDADQDLRRSAVEALGRIGDPKAIGPLLKVLGNQEDEWAVEPVRNALVQLGYQEEALGAERATQPEKNP
jgi:HEAT repeat protein